MRRTRSQVSFNMSRVKSSGTQIEQLMAASLRRNRLKFTRFTHLFGNPDFVLTDKKATIFCDSSFWHGYKFLKTPRHHFKTNKKFWVAKISGNIRRDRLVNRTLKKQGWKVVRFWDFQIKKDINKCVAKLEKALKSNRA